MLAFTKVLFAAECVLVKVYENMYSAANGVCYFPGKCGCRTSQNGGKHDKFTKLQARPATSRATTPNELPELSRSPATTNTKYDGRKENISETSFWHMYK